MDSERKPSFDLLARKFRTSIPQKTTICSYCGFDFGDHKILDAACPYEELRQEKPNDLSGLRARFTGPNDSII